MKHYSRMLKICFHTSLVKSCVLDFGFIATLFPVTCHLSKNNPETLHVTLCMLCILYLKSTHKNGLQKTNKYRLIDATLTPGDQVWSLPVVATAAATAYSDEV